MKKLLLLAILSSLSFSNETYYSQGKLTELTPINNTRDIKNNNDIRYYSTKGGQKVGVTDQILLKCNNGVDCNKVLSKYSFKNIVNITPALFMVTIEDSNNIFEISKELYLNKNIKFAHPNFSQKIYKR